MSESLRRSSRRSSRKESPYSVGDFVEVTRNEQSFKGKLLYELSELSTKFPRWLVAMSKLDGTSWKEEELYEKDFKMWEARPQRSRTNSNGNVTALPPRKKQKTSSSAKSSSSSEAEESRSTASFNNSKTVKTKAVSFTESSPALTEAEAIAAAKEAARVSARQQRSMRRQAKVEEEVVQLVGGDTTTTRKRSRTHDSKKSRKGNDGEEVIKVPMLTGTLYLYRGPVRRAEFVRRF